MLNVDLQDEHMKTGKHTIIQDKKVNEMKPRISSFCLFVKDSANQSVVFLVQSFWRRWLCGCDWAEPQHIRHPSPTSRTQPGHGADGANIWGSSRGHTTCSGQPLSHCRDLSWAHSWDKGLITQEHMNMTWGNICQEMFFCLTFSRILVRLAQKRVEQFSPLFVKVKHVRVVSNNH